MWGTALEVLAQTAPVAPTQPSHTYTVPVWLASIITTIVLVIIIGLIGKVISPKEHWDNFFRTILVLFGVVGVLAQTPLGKDIAEKIESALRAGVALAGGGGTAFVVVAAVFVFLGAYGYFKRGNGLGLVVMVIFTMPLFNNDTMAGATDWYMETIGSPVFHGVVGFFKELINR